MPIHKFPTTIRRAIPQELRVRYDKLDGVTRFNTIVERLNGALLTIEREEERRVVEVFVKLSRDGYAEQVPLPRYEALKTIDWLDMLDEVVRLYLPDDQAILGALLLRIHKSH